MCVCSRARARQCVCERGNFIAFVLVCTVIDPCVQFFIVPSEVESAEHAKLTAL